VNTSSGRRQPANDRDLPAPGTNAGHPPQGGIRGRRAEAAFLEEACSRYTLTVDEFLSWQFSIDKPVLRASHTAFSISSVSGSDDIATTFEKSASFRRPIFFHVFGF